MWATAALTVFFFVSLFSLETPNEWGEQAATAHEKCAPNHHQMSLAVSTISHSVHAHFSLHFTLAVQLVAIKQFSKTDRAFWQNRSNILFPTSDLNSVYSDSLPSSHMLFFSLSCHILYGWAAPEGFEHTERVCVCFSLRDPLQSTLNPY